MKTTTSENGDIVTATNTITTTNTAIATTTSSTSSTTTTASTSSTSTIASFESESILSAKDIQQVFYNYFGYKNGILWDCYGRTFKDALRRKIDLIFPKIVDTVKKDENPETDADDHADDKELEKNSRELSEIDTDDFVLICDENEIVTKNIVLDTTELNDDKLNKYKNIIVDAIWLQKKYNSGILLMAPIFIVCLRDATKNELSVNYSIHPVFRVKKCHNSKINNNRSSRNCCMIFIDENGRVYQNWNDYKTTNNLPDGYVIAPKNGIYNSDHLNQVILEKFWSPAHFIANKIFKVTDVGTTIVGCTVSGLTIAAVTIPAIALGPAVLVGATAIGIGCGAYSFGRGIYNLMDRSKHEQTLNLKDSEARGYWFDVAGSAVGLGAGAVSKGISFFARTSSDISKIISGGINVLNVSSITVNGAAVVNGFVGLIYDKTHNDKKITNFNLLELEASLFLFTHSLYNFQLTECLMTKLNDQTIVEFKIHLSEYQRLQFERYDKEYQLLKRKINNENIGDDHNDNYDGDHQLDIDVIRLLRNIPDNEMYFNEFYKGNNSIIPKNGENVDGGDDDKDDNVKAFLAEYINGIVANNNNEFSILNENHLVASMKNYFNCLSIEAFQIFLAIVKSFVREYGDKIQQTISRYIAFEQFLDDSFKIFYTLANHKLDELNDLILDINNFEITYNCITIYYYEQYGIQDVTNNNNNNHNNNKTERDCKLCGGKYFIESS